MAGPKVARSTAQELSALLDSPEIRQLIADLEETRWTGRPGYPIRVMVGLALAKSLYALPTWTKVVALVGEHWALQRALGCEGEPPSLHAAYRFAEKLRQRREMVERCIDGVVAGLRDKLPDYGKDLALDASDMPAYANGHRRLADGRERLAYSDPDASWGHRSAVATRKGGGFYGYKIQAAVCVNTGLPVAWTIATAKRHESAFVADLLDGAMARGASAETAAMDRGYDNGNVHALCAERDCLPVIPLKETAGVVKGRAAKPECRHGVWKFAGADRKRGAAKWRCPTGECTPASKWIKADRLHPLIPHKTKRWAQMYRRRGAVEREFGRLKHEWALGPLRVRGLDRVRLHADLTILTKLACALSRVRAAATTQRQRGSGSAQRASRPVSTRSLSSSRRE
jgi:hypothetical protein